MPRRFSYPYDLQLFFGLVVLLALFFLFFTLHAVVLLHFLSPPKVFDPILRQFLRIMLTFPGKRGCQTKILVLKWKIRKLCVFFNLS